MWYYLLLWLYLLYVMVAIIFLNNLLFKKLKFTEKLDVDLPAQWKPFERYDRQEWRIIEIYFGAIFLLPIRVCIMFLILLIIFVLLFFGEGVKYEQQWPRQKYLILRQVIRYLGNIFMFAAGFYNIKHKNLRYQDFDKDYVQLEKDRNNKTPCILICNHVSHWDGLYIALQYLPSFLAKAQARNLPFFGYFAQRAKAIFVERESKDSKHAVLEQIKVRVNQIQNNQSFPPVVIFPEGTTSNGKYLLQFKRGAFESFAPIQIICLKYQDRYFNLADDVMGMVAPFLAMTQLKNSMECYEFEGVYNPEFLNDNSIPYEEKVINLNLIQQINNKWQRYAEKTRDIMAKCLNVEKSQSKLDDLRSYEKHLFKDSRRTLVKDQRST